MFGSLLDLDRELLQLVRRVLARPARPRNAVALHRLDEDDRRLALVLDRGLVRRVDLERVVPAALERP